MKGCLRVQGCCGSGYARVEVLEKDCAASEIAMMLEKEATWNSHAEAEAAFAALEAGEEAKMEAAEACPRLALRPQRPAVSLALRESIRLGSERKSRPPVDHSTMRSGGVTVVQLTRGRGRYGSTPLW